MRCNGVGEREVTSCDATGWERGNARHAMRRGGREGMHVMRCDGVGERECASCDATGWWERGNAMGWERGKFFLQVRHSQSRGHFTHVCQDIPSITHKSMAADAATNSSGMVAASLSAIR